MARKEKAPPEAVVLVSAPWPLYSQPSIQLGTLKSYLRNHYPETRVDARHFYLQVAESLGYEWYRVISERVWSAESCFAALMFPERLDAIERLFYRETAKRGRFRGEMNFRKVVELLGSLSETFVRGTNWGEYGLVGFSICLCQLTSSLYLMKRIKEEHPRVPTVVGGSALGGNPGRGFFKAFPWVDYLVPGEGERPLAELIGLLRTSSGSPDASGVQGVITGSSGSREPDLGSIQLPRLNDLPTPDYDDYFALLQTFPSQKRFFPTLPAEMSRGCWWRRPSTARRPSGCAFCNLNLQWEGYRAKDPSRIVSEVDSLTSRHKVLSVAFMDNVLPANGSEKVFQGFMRLGKDLRLFGEIRAATAASRLRMMKAAGFHDLQIGIEALATSLLKKMRKGSSAIRNLEIMKNCEESGLVSHSNLILEFPGSDEADVEETLRCLDYAQVFRPLRAVSFWLGLGSPIACDPASFGVKAIYNHPNYRVLFPPAIVASVPFIIQGFRGERTRQKRLWLPVREKLKDWKSLHEGMNQSGGGEAPLFYRDGRTFLIVHQKRPGQSPITHRLPPLSREIYLFCRKTRSLKGILGRFPKVTEEKLVPFLRMMEDKRLMFRERDEVLSLALSARDRERIVIGGCS